MSHRPSSRPPAITMRLSGGLGNQLFQYAAGRSLSHRLGCELLLDAGPLDARIPGVTPRSLELDSFAHRGCIVRTPKGPQLLPLAITSRWNRWSGGLYIEPDNGFDSGFSSVRPGTNVEGYFQSPRYFDDISSEIVSEIGSLREPTSWFQEQADALAGASVAAVHIRRADYLLGSNREFHGVLQSDYYNSAVEHLSQIIDLDEIIVFSDDPQGAEEMPINWPTRPLYVSAPSNSDPIESLLLMSQACTVVTANSSFSWWAGYIAEQRHGAKVLAPSPWYYSPSMPEADLIPRSWTRVRHSWEVRR